MTYRIFTECNSKGRGFRQKFNKGTQIRLDLVDGFPFYKVTELLKINNWKVTSRYQNGVNQMTYYIAII